MGTSIVFTTGTTIRTIVSEGYCLTGGSHADRATLSKLQYAV
jgi:hypothetical protein